MKKDFSILDSFEFGIREVSQNFVFFLKTYLIQIPYWILSLMLPAIAIFPPFVWKVSKIFSEFLTLTKSDATTVDYKLMGQYLVQRFIDDGLVWWFGVAFVILMLFIFISSIYIILGYTKIGLNILDGKKNTVGTLYSQRRLLRRGFLGNLLVLIPFIFSIFLVWFLIYTFFPQIYVLLSHSSQESIIWFFSTFSVFLMIPAYIFMAVFSFFQYVLVDENSGIIEAFKVSAKITSGVRLKLFLFILIYSVINSFVGRLPFGLPLILGLIMWPISLLTYLHIYRTLKQQTFQEEKVSR